MNKFLSRTSQCPLESNLWLFAVSPLEPLDGDPGGALEGEAPGDGLVPGQGPQPPAGLGGGGAGSRYGEHYI